MCMCVCVSGHWLVDVCVCVCVCVCERERGEAERTIGRDNRFSVCGWREHLLFSTPSLLSNHFKTTNMNSNVYLLKQHHRCVLLRSPGFPGLDPLQNKTTLITF